ncbi:Long-chain-fatty-acid--CoA ligase 5 [Hypsizygus marmoreus]|uniref:Long-chain-fatty-acid--CoA ligase 5 n=1 Tax=Hypsizygus marmoreus TaxID=39966 RepID=A0A369JPR2_HYPMA|nr:Long-chain-fatty-acid--CoA ligase 5 [Hypsizygus marmoreus]
MAFSIADYLVTDDLTILLGLIAATVFLLNNLYKPQPLVHPILLGRQSDVARVRNPGESAVYRNYGTGLMGRFPIRPSKEVFILADFVKPDSEGSRTLWSTRLSNNTLQDRVASFGTGLLRLAGLRPKESTVLLLLNDSIEFIISDLALASHSIQSFTLSSSKLLSYVLESHVPSAIITHADLLPQILELIYESDDRSGNHTIIVVGEPSARTMASVASNVKVLNFVDVEREGVKVEKIISPLPNANDIFTVSFFESESGHVQAAQLTHENMTAGVAATRGLLPLSHALSSLDTIVSAHPLSTAYGRAVAYTAIFEGTSFATLDSSKLYHPEEHSTTGIDVSDAVSHKAYPIPSPTVLFVKPGHLESTVSSIVKHASRSFLLYPFARRHKLASVSEGYISKESLWDRLVYDGARAKVIGDGASTLRGIIISGGNLGASVVTPARVALSIPLINSYTHPLVPGPVLASHPLDLQDFPAATNESSVAHVGPPSVNTEVKLVGVDDEAVENGADPVGLLLIRGPSVGKLFVNDDYVSIPSEDDKEGWVATGIRAKIQSNGAFQVLTPLVS